MSILLVFHSNELIPIYNFLPKYSYGVYLIKYNKNYIPFNKIHVDLLILTFATSADDEAKMKK
jgi:hypothetical protein